MGDRKQLAEQLAAAQSRIGKLEGELARLSLRDPLTPSLLSLSAFRTQLELDVARAQRYERPLTVALLDIDRFRNLNLAHGYAAGDAVLAAVGGLIAAEIRVHDLACRMGGDEFGLLLPETSAQRLSIRSSGSWLSSRTSRRAGFAASRPRWASPDWRSKTSRSPCSPRRGRRWSRRAPAGAGRPCSSAALQRTARRTHEPGNGDVIAALASALQERDRYTGDHSESVVDLTARVGEALALGAEEISRVRTAALLHDIGKVGVPDEILHKPGPLSDREWEIMRQHPAIGERILRAIPGLGDVARIVRHEHERWDGTGYPDMLAGAAIPAGSRIILACDAYHAMTSDRPYRQAMPHDEALAELSSNAGIQFDPDVVQALVGYLFGRRQAGLAAV